MTNALKIFSALFFALTLTACSDSRGDHLVTTAAAGTAFPASLKASMTVGYMTGGGSYLFDPDAVRDSEFKTALEKSLAANGLLAQDAGAYKIDAEIDSHLSTGTATDDRVLIETVIYRVMRLSDQKIFETTVKTSYTVPGSSFAAYAGTNAMAWGRKKYEANNKVTSDNLAEFMKKLAAWDQATP